MIPTGVEIFVGLDPIDLRWGFDRLCDVVSEHIGRQARSGALFVFFGRRREALKILFADRTGICVLYKRLDRGRFALPLVTDATSRRINERALQDLLDGLDLEERSRRKPRITRH
jgi:transposase